MVNRLQIDKIGGATSQDTAANHKPGILSSQKNLAKVQSIDDVIGSLANAYENKRARQVIEWERLWRQNISDVSRPVAM